MSFAERSDLSVKDITEKFGVDGLLVVSAQRTSFICGGQEFFFHPGLARLRIKELKNGKADQMIKAMSLMPGESVLDCTLGPGADAIVASYVSGPNGRVTGLEASPIISVLVGSGLSTYPEEEDITAAMRRINVINTDYRTYLSSLEPCSYDIIYFDPMFRAPRHKSPAMNSVRLLADPAPVEKETINLALRAAAKRVVLKERRGSAEFERLGFKHVVGGNYAPVAYGVMERQGVLD
ncbi:MAG: class I SAM-dependent methyltransferase [Peptococcaceae bacterium]|nr:class I SAM-dependent methyltransferase [Peptococcaceae bacterium]